MSSGPPGLVDSTSPSPSAVRRMERACDAFESAWAGGGRPSIEAHLPGPGGPAVDSLALRELILLDLLLRRRSGEDPAADEYRARFPGHPGPVAAAFAAAAEEGETVDVPAPPRGDRGAGGGPEIPGYEVLGELGRGGMGVVYRARAERPARLVALKMILAGDLAGPEAAARFLAEAEAVARLQHPQVVQIFRIGDHSGRPFLEMEFVEGGSLAARLDGTPRPPREAAALVESLARAVAHAHARGIVHRDLKPANVLMTPDGTPKVTDFGLAKSLGGEGDGGEGLTRTNWILGSPSYMAPEQAGGPDAVGPATDVHALGAILFELLTGRPPFRAATIFETLELVRSADPPAPSRLVPGVPIDLETIALRCLQKEPHRRYAGADALAEDLRRFSAGEPILARPVGALGRGWKWARRRPLTAALAGTAAASVVLLVAVLAAAFEASRRQRAEIRGALAREIALRRELAEANAQLSDRQRRTAADLEARTTDLAASERAYRRERRAAYLGRIARADAERRAGRDAPARALLDACPEDLRSWEWRLLAAPAGARPRAFAGHRGEAWDAAVSPDGSTLASAGFDHTVRLWDVATGRPLKVLEGHTARVYSVNFDRAGRRLVSASADRTAIIWDVDSGRPIHVLSGHADNVRCAAFDPPGSTVATGGWDGKVKLWVAGSGRPIRSVDAAVGWITRLAFSPDGERLAVGGSAGHAEVYSSDLSVSLLSLDGQAGPILGVAWSPDGSRLATASNLDDRGLIRVWTDRGAGVLSFRDDSAMIERLSYSPDGRRIVTSGWDGPIRLWDSADGSEVLALPGHSGRAWSVGFSPAGDAVVSAGEDGAILLWDAGRAGAP